MSNYVALRGKLEWVPGSSPNKTTEAVGKTSTTDESSNQNVQTMTAVGDGDNRSGDDGTVVVTKDGSYWKWTGVWAFGDRIVQNQGTAAAKSPVGGTSATLTAASATTAKTTTKRLLPPQLQQPFEYKWERKILPSEILVPSAQLAIENETEGDRVVVVADETEPSIPGTNTATPPKDASATADIRTLAATVAIANTSANTTTTTTTTSTNTTASIATATNPPLKASSEENLATTRTSSSAKASGGTTAASADTTTTIASTTDPASKAEKSESTEVSAAATSAKPDEITKKSETGVTKEPDTAGTGGGDHKNLGNNVNDTVKMLPLDPKEKQEAESTTATPRTKNDQQMHGSAGGEEQPDRAETKLITFATVEPGDPPFTDAAELNKCPPSGQWLGFFRNATGRNRDRTHRVNEDFYLFLNATPSPIAKCVFDDEVDEEPIVEESTPSAVDNNNNNSDSNRIPPGQVQVRGMGSNQFGTFELIGMLELDTMILEIQRKYVMVAPEPSPSGRTGRRSFSTNTAIASSTVVTRHKSTRPYHTRKRQPSWKRKSSYDEEEAAASAAQAALTSSSAAVTAGSYLTPTGRRKKRPKLSPTNAAAAGAASMLVGGMVGSPTATSSTSGATLPMTVSSLPGVAAPGAVYLAPAPLTAPMTMDGKSFPSPEGGPLVPSGPFAGASSIMSGGGVEFGKIGRPTLQPFNFPSPAAPGTTAPRKRSVSGSSPRHAAGSAKSPTIAVSVPATTAAPTVTSSAAALLTSPYLKLPPVGDPKKACWRAAHFLYYQRHDPNEEAPHGPASSSPCNNIVHNANHGNAYSSSMAAAAAAASTSLYGGGGSNNTTNSSSTTNNINANLPITTTPNTTANTPAAVTSTNTNISHSSIPSNPRYVIYEGEMLDTKREGRGICLYSNGMLYEGSWKRDKEHGKGKLMTADRQRIIYEGDFERGRMQGVGTYYYAQAENSLSASSSSSNCPLTPNGTAGRSGSTAVAPTTNPSGGTGAGKKKTMSTSRIGGDASTLPGDAAAGGKSDAPEDPGSRYTGDFKENMRNGYGTYIFPDGSVYTGMWRDGMMCGRGVFTWPDQSVYDGEWKDGKRYVYFFWGDGRNITRFCFSRCSTCCER
jgi:hypothetical protein